MELIWYKWHLVGTVDIDDPVLKRQGISSSSTEYSPMSF